jgi:hypothetical protein
MGMDKEPQLTPKKESPEITWSELTPFERANVMQNYLMLMLGGQLPFYSDPDIRSTARTVGLDLLKEWEKQKTEQVAAGLMTEQEKAADMESLKKAYLAGWDGHDIEFWNNEGYAEAFDKLVKEDPAVLDIDVTAPDAEDKMRALGPRLVAHLDPNATEKAIRRMKEIEEKQKLAAAEKRRLREEARKKAENGE